MIDEIKTSKASSYKNFGASLKSKKVKAPSKKSIKRTVPFSSKTYDFSNIDGEIYFTEQEIEYVLEMSADSAEKLSQMKRTLKNWLMKILNEYLYDPFILGYRYQASFKDIKFDDSEDGEYTAVTVTFSAYPYLIADEEKVHGLKVTKQEQIFGIENNSSHRVYATVTTNIPITLKIGNATFSLKGYNERFLPLECGTNVIKFKSDSGEGLLTVSFFEEVL